MSLGRLLPALTIIAALPTAGLAAADDVPSITPVGITVAALGDIRGKDGVLRIVNNRKGTDTYADANGMTLYTYTKDENGKSVCTDECAVLWRAVTPLPGAKAGGPWTLIDRQDGGKQWAYNSRPVYTHAKDQQRGDKAGEALESGAWQVLKPRLTEGGVYPFGIKAHDVPDAGGEVLIDSDGKTLYAFTGDLKQDKASCYAAPCAGDWIVLAAPAVAKTRGDFTVATRPDGTRQWAFKGRPLYRYAGDVLPDDVNGSAIDKRWQPALVTRYPMPAEVTIRSTPANGKMFATAKGMSLYRYSFYQRVQSSDELRAGPYITALAQALGTESCVDKCLQSWRPLIAPKNAQPSWHWTILTRDDGTRQWAYRGHALYTFVGDKKPGDLTGLNIWDTAVNDTDLRRTSLLTKINADNQLPSSFYWTTAYP